MDKYEKIVPLMFNIFKDLGTVSLHKFNEFIRISGESINLFMANWK